ncbi:MAG: tetratricopeptide repeat protein [Bacteroidota bacterium]
MKRIASYLCVFALGLTLMGADGCSSDPNVEGAKLDLRNKDYDRAIENLNSALERNPDNAEALELKGRVLMQQAEATNDPSVHEGLVPEIVESFSRAKDVDPSMAQQVENNMDLAYYNTFTKGVQAFNRSESDPSEFDNAAAFFTLASVIRPDSAGAYVNKAYALYNSGNREAAREPLEMAIEKGENNAQSYILLSNVYTIQEDFDAQVKLLQDATKVFPDDADIRAQYLNALQRTGQLEMAMTEYSAAVASDPDNPVYRYNYGSMLLDGEMYDEAEEQLRKATELDPENANAFYNLGAVFINQAFAINEEIAAADDALRAERGNLSEDEITSREAALDEMVEKRGMMYENAVAPLERAKTLAEQEGLEQSGICNALFQAYVQTGETEKGTAAAECAGIDIN